MWDPRSEKGRHFDRLFLSSSLPPPAPGLTILGSRVEAGSGKLVGLEPRDLDGFTYTGYGLVLVEADGSRGLPVKAPASHEPAIPVSSDLVLGLIGLDCLGSPASAATVHRLEAFLALSGAHEGEPISPGHLARLVASPEGLFRNSPEAARRVLILNKADLVPEAGALGLKAHIEAGAAADARVSDVLIASNR
jgi:probable selenium-dependent hydroxylase accessory protein YqeC